MIISWCKVKKKILKRGKSLLMLYLESLNTVKPGHNVSQYKVEPQYKVDFGLELKSTLYSFHCI